MQYKLLVHYGPKVMEQEVNAALSEGWVLRSFPIQFIADEAGKNALFVVEMIRLVPKAELATN